MRVETLLFNALEPPDPLLLGEAEIDAGAVRVLDSPAPKLGDDDLAAAALYLPFARSEVESRFVRTVRSFADSARTELRIDEDAGLASPAAPCTKTSGGGSSTAECPGVGTELIADNDAGTAPLVNPAAASPSPGGGGTIARGNGTISLVLGASNLASSLATAASTAVGNNDELPYAKGAASGPASYSMPFDLGAPEGSLATFSAAPSTNTEIDRQGTGTSSTISAVATVSHPAIDLLTFTLTPTNAVDGTALTAYAGMVRAGAANVSVTAAAGPSAPAAGLTAAPVTILLFRTDAAGVGSYLPVVVTPGSATSASSTATFGVGGQQVTVTATVTAAPKVVESTVAASTTLRSSTRLVSWLKIRLDVTSTATNQFSYELDYGRVVAETTYEEPS